MRLLYISICRLPFISQNDFISLYIYFLIMKIDSLTLEYSQILEQSTKKKKRLQKYKFKIKAFLDLFWSNVTNSSQQLLYSQFHFPLKKQPNSSCNKKILTQMLLQYSNFFPFYQELCFPSNIFYFCSTMCLLFVPALLL